MQSGMWWRWFPSGLAEAVGLSRPDKSARGDASQARGWTLSRGVSSSHLLLFVREIRALVKAGVPIPEAVRLLADRTEHPRLKRALGAVRSDVERGKLLSQAIEAQGAVFPATLSAAVRAGEASGTLPEVLGRFGEWLARRVSLGRKITASLAYPAVMAAAFGAILLFLFLYVLPRFAAIYADMEVELPLPTRVLILIVQAAWSGLPFLLPAVLVSGFLAVRYAGTDAGRRRLASLLLGLPVLGPVVRGLSVAQTVRTLELLLRGGVPIMAALSITSGAVTNRAIGERIERARKDVEQGKGIARSLEAHQVVPAITARMLEVGERSGSLTEMLGEVGAFHEEEVEARLATFTSLLEPVLMLFMGAVVGTIIVVMYLPIFSLAEAVR